MKQRRRAMHKKSVTLWIMTSYCSLLDFFINIIQRLFLDKIQCFLQQHPTIFLDFLEKNDQLNMSQEL